jgi:sugar phosphate isomerase/epimerase
MRYAICNETFDGWDHARICRFIASLGYTGLEIAPFTLAPRITDVTAEQRKRLRGEAEQAGVQIVGLHWLLARTTGLQVTSPDATVRRRTADYLGELARCCHELGGRVMVFGSPAQRAIPDGCTHQQAMNWALDTFWQALPLFSEYNVQLALEPLAPDDTPFITTCAEAVRMINTINHPNFVLHQDVKAMSAEPTPVPDLVRQFGSQTAHFHANDANKRGPGFGATDFVPIFHALKDVHYQGWVSVEVFDYTPDPETIARQSIEYMQRCERS